MTEYKMEVALKNLIELIEQGIRPITNEMWLDALQKGKDALEQFKRDNPSPDSAQPKQEVKYPEGIESVKVWNGSIVTNWGADYQIWCKWHLSGQNKSEIWSVRNAAGDVFTVGEKVVDGVIVKFLLPEKSLNFIRAIMEDSIHHYAIGSFNIDSLKKAPVKQPLFLSEDSENVFYGDDLYCVKLPGMQIKHSPNWACDSRYSNDFALYFKHRHNAEAYVAENRKSVSWRELKEYIDKNAIRVYTNNQYLIVLYTNDLLNHFSPHQKPAPGEDGERK